MTYLKKILITINLLLITSIGYVYGDCDDTSSIGENENCCSCQPTCCGKGFISADLLYWRAFESGLDICIPNRVSDTITSDGNVISKFSGRSRDLDFKWDPGFRIGTGYEFACCCNWDIGVFWTHFHSHAHSSRNCGNKLRWNINYDVIDIIVGSKADLGACFALRPFFGLRGARIHQKVRIDNFSYSTSCYTSNDYYISNDCYTSNDYYTSNDFEAIKKNNKERFQGIGPIIGLEVDWNIWCDFSFYTSASISWLYGHFHIRLIDSEEFVDAVNFCKVTKRHETNLAVADAALGIRWQKCFCTDTRLILQVGLEHHRYFDFNQIGGNCGDLSFDGVTFSAIVEF